MDKINNEINNIKNTQLENEIKNDHKYLEPKNDNNQATNQTSEAEKEKNILCESYCICENCVRNKPENKLYKTVSFKNHDQVDILVEHDKKQACCVIYNNNCCIF